MKTRDWSLIAALYTLALAGSVLHCMLPPAPHAWREVLPHLYYVPIVIAAINLGAKTAIGVAIASGAAHAIVTAWGCGDSWSHVSLETLLFAGVGIIAARMARMHETLEHVPRALVNVPGGEPLARAFSGSRSASDIPGLSQIVAGLIHRFRTPVSSIEGAVWLLEDARVSQEKRQEFVGIIRKESHQLDRALSEILDFTQPRNPRFRKVNLSTLVDEVIQLAGPREHGPFFLFRKEISPALPPLLCDRDQIKAMLLSLSMNAIEAMPGGGQVTIAIRTEGERVVISVADHGHGIAPEVIDRIFDPFFSTRENALGLGLTVARTIALAHSGTIAVNTNSPSGARLSVVLPLDPADAHEHGPHTGG